ncbi:interleukin-2 receptor subunit alpha-like [Sceloporus undulatus]|uniref:interleukin-2 receptor subunit alpha-like n=1 Tax=Sceloporus undulatus TaxID=8520 RepID=UPI001C4C41DD|nr:interleukin-2 receptor subunit alpha-like [Sceloporus undulatus]
MSSFCTGFGLVLIWGAFQSALGAGKGECPTPKTIGFAEYFAEWYVVGTRLRYECQAGFKRPAGKGNNINCENRSAQAQWTCRSPPVCTAASELIHRSARQPSVGDCEGSSNSSQTPTQQMMKGVCGVPKPLKHATTKVFKYVVGQELQYRCLDGYRAWTPISEVITCEDSNGRVEWSKLSLHCTNDSSSVPEGTTKTLLSSDFYTVLPDFASLPPNYSSAPASEQVMKAFVFTAAVMAAVIIL